MCLDLYKMETVKGVAHSRFCFLLAERLNWQMLLTLQQRVITEVLCSFTGFKYWYKGKVSYKVLILVQRKLSQVWVLAKNCDQHGCVFGVRFAPTFALFITLHMYTTVRTYLPLSEEIHQLSEPVEDRSVEGKVQEEQQPIRCTPRNHKIHSLSPQGTSVACHPSLFVPLPIFPVTLCCQTVQRKPTAKKNL